jgi:hypothetical protein
LVDDLESATTIRQYYKKTLRSHAPRIITRQGDQFNTKAVLNPNNKCPSEDRLDFIFGANPYRSSSTLETKERGMCYLEVICRFMHCYFVFCFLRTGNDSKDY